jgi:AraC family transcriptional regulator
LNRRDIVGTLPSQPLRRERVQGDSAMSNATAPATPASAAHAGARHLAPGQFFGGVVRRRCEEGLVLTELVHGAARKLPAHDHEAAGVCLLLAGSYRESVGARTVELRPGAAVYHPPAYRHRDEVGEGGASFFFVELADGFAARVGAALPPAPRVDRRGVATALARRLRDELAGDDPAARLAREGLALELVAAFARLVGDDPLPRWLLLAERCLRERLEHRWSLTELAAEAGVSPVRLSRGFRRSYGESVGDRLRRLRLEAARDRLRQPASDLAAVALDCGFADQSHLTRAFRAAFGVTPGAFRARTATGA